MIVQDLQLELWQEKDGLLSHLDEVLRQSPLLIVALLGSPATSLDQVQHLRQDQVHMREKVSGPLANLNNGSNQRTHEINSKEEIEIQIPPSRMFIYNLIAKS